MEMLSGVEAPGSVKLVKVLTLVVGLLSILGGISGEGGPMASVLAVAFGVCCVATTIRIKHGSARRMEISVLMVAAAVLALGSAVASRQLMELFGLLIPIGVLLWANTGTGRAWFDGSVESPQPGVGH